LSTISLPERPNTDQLRNQARELQKSTGVKLTQAQTNLARSYGFPSWPKLIKHVELVTQFTRTPDTVQPSSDPADEFLRTVCLAYGHNDDTRIATRPADDLATANVWTAAATGSYEALMQMRGEATRVGGPFDWEPLMYLCYARVEMAEFQAVASARLLLNAGADPNAGYLWHGLPSPFTALTGVFGNGEGSQPPHPHALALARVLLERGADPNDAQTLYNRQFEPGVEHLELLFEFGLGQGDGGPWKEKLTAALDAPAEMLRQQLRWAIHHDMRDRVRLLAENGVDMTTPYDDPRFGHCLGRTPAQWAALCGNGVIGRTLALHGATVEPLAPVDEFIGLLMAGDASAASRIEAIDADIVRDAQHERPSLIVQAAATKRMSAVRSVFMHGFDINALGRADSPCEQPWQTALHTAVERGDAEMVQLLLELGADPSITDARFNATPRGWAEHFGNDRIAALLP